jgi:hypothetical protein
MARPEEICVAGGSSMKTTQYGRLKIEAQQRAVIDSRCPANTTVRLYGDGYNVKVVELSWSEAQELMAFVRRLKIEALRRKGINSRHPGNPPNRFSVEGYTVEVAELSWSEAQKLMAFVCESLGTA